MRKMLWTAAAVIMAGVLSAGDSIVGNWKGTWGNKAVEMEFHQDGTYVMRVSGPADANWQKVQQGATVFQKTEGYIWLSTIQYMNRPGQGPAGTAKNNTKWFFHSNGRVFITVTTYLGSEKPRDLDQPFGGLYYIDSAKTNAGWGSYTIGQDDSLHVVFDDGSMLDARFIDGRRNLHDDQQTCGNVEWESEALQRELHK